MIASMLWKEWREQRAIGLAILAFGAGAIALTAQMADPSTSSPTARAFGVEGAGSRELIAVALAYLAGSVCGAMLIADEKEAGTFEFLSSMPASRWKIWVAKAIFGMTFSVVQSVLLTLLANALGCLDAEVSLWRYGTFVIMVGELAFAWGMFGGTLARSTLGAVFHGAGGATVSAIVLSIPFSLLFWQRPVPISRSLVPLAFYLLWLLTGFAASAAVFTRTDRARRAPRTGRAAAIRGKHAWKSSTFALLWLALRQSIRITAAAWALGLFVGAVMVTPAAQPVLIWPVATMTIGVLAGTTALGEEQTRGIARYWAERRLPLGRLWLVKIATHFTLAAIAALLMFLPLFASVPMSPFRTALFSREALRPELFRFLWLGLVYGFVVGHLCGMLFRKTIVAGLASIVAASSFAALILPAVIGGGASAWQIWAPAFVLLLTARILVYPWATERIAARGPLLRAIGGTSLAISVLGLGVLFRIYEIPEAQDALAESGFEDSIPPFEQNEGGRQTRSAAAKHRQAVQEAQPIYPGPKGAAGRGGGAGNDAGDPLDRAARRGWDEGDKELKLWLDRIFASDWITLLDELHDKPLGVYEDPRVADFFSPPDFLRDLRDMQLALRARMNQRTAEGHPEEFTRLLRNGLLAARTAKNKCGIAYANLALDTEESMLAGLRDWLASTPGDAADLRQLLRDLERHERDMPISVEDQNSAEEIRLRNTMDRVGGWAIRILEANRSGGSGNASQVEAEAEIVAIAWSVPWERSRRERMLRYHSHSNLQVPEAWLSGLHLKQLWKQNRAARLEPRESQGLTSRRFAILQIALRLFEVEHGAPARSLEQLVPEYLPAIPEDPYSGRPFRYRLSTGEVLNPDSLDAHDPALAGVYLGSAVVSSLAHPFGGWNGGWAIGLLLTRPPSNPIVGVTAMAFSPPAGNAVSPPVLRSPRSRIVPRGTGVIWSVGQDGIDDGGRRTFFGSSDVPKTFDWVVLVPSIQNLSEKKPPSP